jgi:hypothetical protein
MGGEYSTHGRNEKCIPYYMLIRKPETGRGKSRDLGVDGIAIQNWI